MNDVLNNIFDDASLDMIRNANKISPSPEQFQTEKVEYKVETKDNVKMTDENRELRIKLEAQKELIRKIISNQNQMVKEFNELCEKVKKLEERPVQKVDQVSEQKVEEKQQTGNGEGLNPNDFKVEDIFYCGR